MELNKIYLGDCLDLMKEIPDKSIDLILTDPPYLHIKGGCKSALSDKYKINGSTFKNSFINTNMSDFGELQINEILTILKLKLKKMNCIVFCSELQLQYYFKWIYENKYKYNLIVWDKGKRMIFNRNRYMSNLEYIIRIYEKNISLKKSTNNEIYSKIKTYKLDEIKLHPTQKPIKLIENFLYLHSNENDVILDPFIGSGTTAIACLNTNRNFIGMEKEQKYFKICIDRINNWKNENVVELNTNKLF